MKIWILIVLSLTMFSCNQKTLNEDELCRAFHTLNKSGKFDFLYNVSIGKGRVENVCNDKLK
ncbi:hypothetical protein QE382_002470 [Sphingobacterium zeae]|uniref:Lipoprotein n=1 Tax=Sphingobacterium zeae TaxID=1776859 RepID=A0ABU0U696_9SPHI|nr:hypothetical protein [Sphingobacterium zeae]